MNEGATNLPKKRLNNWLLTSIATDFSCHLLSHWRLFLDERMFINLRGSQRIGFCFKASVRTLDESWYVLWWNNRKRPASYSDTDCYIPVSDILQYCAKILVLRLCYEIHKFYSLKSRVQLSTTISLNVSFSILIYLSLRSSSVSCSQVSRPAVVGSIIYAFFQANAYIPTFCDTFWACSENDTNLPSADALNVMQ